MVVRSLDRVLPELRSARQAGQGLAEYGMILVWVSIFAIVALFALAPKINVFFETARSSLPS